MERRIVLSIQQETKSINLLPWLHFDLSEYQFALSDIQIIRPIPLMPTVAISGTAIKRPVSDRVKPSFVIFDIRTL